MRLCFGSIQIDTKGLPAVSSIYVHPPVSEDRPVLVHISLAGDQRAAVEKWAKRLGAPVVEELRPLYEGDRMPLEVSTSVESGGYKVSVWVRTAASAESAGGAR